MFAASLTAPKASAQTPLLNYTPTFFSSTRTDGPYTQGTLFQVGAVGQTVSTLGIQDVNSDGVAAGSQVGLWNSTGTTLLGSVTVTNADALVGTYRFHNLGTSIVLAANTQYLIGALGGTGFEPFIDNTTTPPFSSYAGFTIVENRFVSGGTLQAPVLDATGVLGRFGPANALVSPAAAGAPEPGSLSLLGMGLVSGAGTLGVVRRRRKATDK